MSRENVDIVRRIYTEGLIFHDPERLVSELGTPDIEYVNPPYAVEPGIRRGPAEVAQALRRAHELFGAPRYVVDRLFDCGDSVVAAVSFHAHGRGSESEAVQEAVHTWTLRDGRIGRFEWGFDRDEALEAAGMRE
jgi:ketosteroid isomerase-like protein